MKTNVLAVVVIAQAAHSINAAYCQAMGDDSQVVWEEAPEWQKQSVVAGVEMHLANPDATPEQSHESWLEQKLNEGWVYGEVKDAESKTHPCCVPYDELPVEQKAKDYIFRATVHALANIELPKPEQVVVPTQAASSSTGLTAKGITVQYIGMRDEWIDRTYNTGLHFLKDQARTMPVHLANKLLRHTDMFVRVEAEEQVAAGADDETLNLIDAAQDKASEDEANNQRHYDILHEVSKMSRDALVNFAADRYQVKLNGRGKADDLRIEVTQLVNQYGAL